MIALLIGANPSPHGHWPPAVTLAAIAMLSWLLPVPGSPS
jgi:hypothetical protein